MKTRRRIGLILVYLSIAMILIGFASMIQPFTMLLYTAGFPIILGGVVLYNVASHL